jgi:hypothetical protein
LFTRTALSWSHFWGALQSATYDIDPGGLKMMYSHSFKEMYLQPRAPATKASGKFRVSSNVGAKRLMECSVHLEGAKTTPKDQLISSAILIATTKVHGLGGHFLGREFKDASKYPAFAGMVVEESLFENVVDVSIKGWMPATAMRTGGVPIGLSQFGTNVGGKKPPNIGTRGSAGLLIRAAQKYLNYDNPALQQADWKTNPGGNNVPFEVS